MIKTKPIEYVDPTSNETFEGVLAWDDETQQQRPGVIVSHTFRGQGEFETTKAVELAQQGYMGFALDMYGKGRRATTKEEADALMSELLSNRPLLLQRVRLAVYTLKNQELVDESRIGGIGFCFGGKCMLDLARSGDDVNGVVSFHGIYDQPGIEHDGDINAAVLVLHGWEDPLAKPESTVALGHELTSRNADWQILAFGHTGHAFTNPNAKMPADGMFYQESSNRRAWQAMKNFLQEIFR